MRTVKLGSTAIETSRLAIGTGSNGWNGRSNQTDLGYQELIDLFHFAYHQGIKFWDLADMYGSHPHAKGALKGLDRDEITISTKTTSRKGLAVDKDVKRFLQETGTEYIDIVLLHCLTERNWPQRYPDAMEALSRCKEQGLIRAHGVSCHDFGALQTSAITEWVEVVLTRINYAGVSMDASPPDIIRTMETMAGQGKGVYGMKVIGMGKLGKEDGGVRQAIEFVLDLPCVHAMTIGMESEAQVQENVAIINELTD